ncbi:MAG: ATP-dependent sacrificial sulfur transferase LarE [bacterium]|nr:ATP-dependent sacrificial sulfur transferase LarE [bacterium]
MVHWRAAVEEEAAWNRSLRIAPMAEASETTDTRRAAALKELRGFGRVLVALSGGVDSAVLLALAVEALGPGSVVAATGLSPAVPERDVDDARRVACQLGVAHEVVPTRELESRPYRANLGDRCFHCRHELFAVLARVAEAHGIGVVAYGAIADDLGDYRPGMRAADESGVAAPLLRAGITKKDVRDIARRAGLVTRDKPAAACLASRIPTGTEVTRARLTQVDCAEQALRALGFGQLRVRHHGGTARIELEKNELGRLEGRDGLRRQVLEAVRGAGYAEVVIDPEGYRTGSLNPMPGADRAEDGNDPG